MNSGASALLVLLVFAGGGLLFLGLVYVLIYNGLVSKKNRADQAFSGIDAQLKKRHDLIPNLVAAVKTYMDHERGTLEEITRLRGSASASGLSTEQRVAVENQITGVLGKILVQAENYPKLQASDNFIHLQRTLNEVEEQLSAARRAYTAAIADWNNGVEMFPSSLVASSRGYQRKPMFEIPETERGNVNVGQRFQA